MLTNHKRLKYFMTTKKLMLRQAKWIEFLSEFNFVISYQSGKKNDKANALMRKPKDRSIDKKNKQLEHYIQVLLPPERFEQPTKVQAVEENKNAHVHAGIPNLLISSVVGQKKLHEAENGKTTLFKEVSKNLLIKRNQLWIPDNKGLQLRVIKEIIDQSAMGHPGQEQTSNRVQQHYY